MVMILLFKEMLKENVRTYMNGKVARQKKEVWLRVHALLFPRPLSPSYEEQAVWDKQRSRILKSDVRKEAKETKECFRFETKTKSLELFSSTDRRLKIKRTKCIHSIDNFFIEKGGWFFIGGPEKVQRRQRAHRIEETAKSYFVLMICNIQHKHDKESCKA